MGDMSKNGPEIHNNESPRAILRRLGVKDEGAAFIPELPDYLGYVFGLLLLWLLYTGYQAMVGMMSDDRSAMGKIGKEVGSMSEKAVSGAKVAIDDVRSGELESSIRS